MALSGAATAQAMIGKKFGRLIPIMDGIETGKAGTRVLCICDCGNEMVVARYSLFDKRRPVRACVKCSKIDKGAKQRVHGLAKTRIYHIWSGMRQRCYDEDNKDYCRYGARGVTIYPEWLDVSNFAEWAYANGYNDSLTIDRKDSNGNYEPDNCRFITFAENSSLTRDTHWLEAFGEKKTIAQWLLDERCVVASNIIYTRWKNLNWSVEDALTTPLNTIRMSRRSNG